MMMLLLEPIQSDLLQNRLPVNQNLMCENCEAVFTVPDTTPPTIKGLRPYRDTTPCLKDAVEGTEEGSKEEDNVQTTSRDTLEEALVPVQNGVGCLLVVILWTVDQQLNKSPSKNNLC